MLYTIRQMFLKGSTIKDAINYIFKMTGKMPTKSEGMKIINMYQDVQKHSGKVIQFPKDRITPFHIPRPGEASPLLKDSPEAIAKIKAENKAAAERLRKKKEAEELFTDERPPKDPDFASGGIARVGYANGSYKSEGLFGIPMEDIRKFKEKERMDRTSPLAVPDDWLERLLRKFRRTETYEQSMESGGIARVGYAAGKIVKGASWVIKSLKKSRKEVIEGTGRF